MPKESAIEVEGVVVEALPNATFRVKVESLTGPDGQAANSGLQPAAGIGTQCGTAERTDKKHEVSGADQIGRDG